MVGLQLPAWQRDIVFASTPPIVVDSGRVFSSFTPQLPEAPGARRIGSLYASHQHHAASLIAA